MCAAVLSGALGSAAACKPSTPPVVPARAQRPQPRSAIEPRADELVAAMHAADYDTIRRWMTPELRARVRVSDLEAASRRLRLHFGDPNGILEESAHREGDLRWYSGLFLYRAAGDPVVITPVLYQFALDGSQRLARLLVREHWFIENLDHPASHYLTVTRFLPPFRGQWTISQGGPTRLTNRHHGSRTQRWAYDIVIKKDGRTRRPGASKRRNASYYCHGQPLTAPAAGTVVKAVDGVRENVPGERGRAGGNGVVIDHGFGEYSALWHAIPGSITVEVGDRVEVGQVVGKVGNSGHSSGPHIHWHVSSFGLDRVRARALPAYVVDVYVDDRWRDRVLPVRGDEVRAPQPRKPRRPAQAAAPSVLIDG
jgi:murein DD-endopeptidase MepM/ murein hydrolase activator NlpD